MQRFCAVTMISLSLTVVRARADDRWEVANAFGTTDDGQPTNNGLTHGTTQLHDLQGAPDTDFGFVRQRAYRSYEARIVDTQHCWQSTTCNEFDRLDQTGAIIQAGVAFDGGTVNSVALRWETDGAPVAYTWTRARGAGAAGAFDSQYEIQFYDTTYTVPRWNNSSTQVTVFLIGSALGRPVSGTIRFFNTTGTLLASAPLSVPATGVQVLSTAGVAGLGGQSGAAVITHTGGYGALAGKAVALEPGTGFSFDTPFAPVPMPR